MPHSFKSLLKERDFLFTFELVPGRSVRTRHYQEILRFLEESTNLKIFQAFSITDNAGGHPALSPIPLGRTIKEFGLEPIIHFSCKDKNRNQLESELLALDREGLHNLLVLTGDYPFYGYLGRAKPVFDLDSVLLLKMITDMESGIELPRGAPGGGVRLPGIPFFKGAVVNPFKLTLSELWWQYLKLYKKLQAGAYFIVTQVGFYPRKWLELKNLLELGITKIFSQFLKDQSLHEPEKDKTFERVPLIGSVLYLTPQLLRALKKGRIPGIFVTEDLLRRLEKASSFEEGALEISAELTAILKGLGYKGVHLCGFPLDYKLIEAFLEKVYKYETKWEGSFEELGNTALIEFPQGVYQREIPCLLKNGFDLRFEGKKSLFYLFNEAMHRLFFNRGNFLYPYLQKVAQFLDRYPRLKGYFTSLEYFIKKLLFNCQECGDCTLWEFNYACPQSGCAKHLLNGPCGGSLAGFCEVYPFVKKCHFVRAMERAPSQRELKKFIKSYLPPRDWALYKSSSWLNFFLRRDHTKDETI
jgi:methylenetetrahydrofolate reductase (NADPH)